MFSGCYRGRRVLVTGHTGFKGSWLALWLSELGADVSGLALAPATSPNHWDVLRLDLARDLRVDLRNAARVSEALDQTKPEIVFHLAAQSLVRPSYADPLATWSTNVMGTAHVLEACRHAGSVRAVVVVTSDKCYENGEANAPFREDDPLGGYDPYSASKAGAEMVAASYRRAFFGDPGSALVATARAGNVIGGGDWSQDRLIPDLVRAVAAGRVLEVRSPDAVRPWQHVLESLGGYLLLGQHLLQGQAEAASAWNFGPLPGDACDVRTVLEKVGKEWPAVAWRVDARQHPHEAKLLQLDSGKARERLGWKPVWELPQALAAAAQWYRGFLSTGEVASRAQLERYAADATASGLPWART
jgi:CDP-glucose 4,6-dehydratase